MTMPRREKTKPTFAVEQAMRIVAGRVMVMPTPTAGPFIAAIVGLEQLWMARATFPPLNVIHA